MILTFIDLALRVVKNRILARLRRLREPRYLIGGIFALAYFWFFFFRRRQGASAKLLLLKQHALTMPALLIDVVSIGVLLSMLLAWALPGDSGGLEFSEAEMAFLFPAPLRRRDLLLYKVLRMQPQAIFSSFMFTFFGWRSGWFVGIWAAMTALGIYFLLVSLGRARLRLMHIGFIPRLIAVAAVLAGLGVIARSRFALLLQAKPHIGNIFGLAAAPFHDPLIRGILFVPRLFAAAAVPDTPATLAISLLAVATFAIAFFYVAAALNVSFEEASIGTSQKRAARRERMRSQQAGEYVVFGRIPPPFRMAERGPIEVAIIWKNLIALLRNSIAWVIVFLFIIAFMPAMAAWSHEDYTFFALGNVVTFLAAIFPLAAPNVFKNDLRLDMPRAEVLKSYPIAGYRLIAAEIAAPLATIAALEMITACVASTMMALSHVQNRIVSIVAAPQFIVTVLLLALPVCALQLVIRNAVPVLLPAWATRAKDEPRGFVAMGQRLMILAANLLTLLITLLPAAIVFFPSLFVAYKFFSGNPAFVAVATMPAVAVIVVEVWIAIRFLGAQFEKLDVSSEMDVMTV